VHPDLGSRMTWQQAMDACDNLTYGGYSDWYLPSKEELNTMYVNKNALGITIINNCIAWWSSTFYGNRNYSDNYWAQAFFDNDWHNPGDQYYSAENNRCNVRCVRKEN
jgi:hypothetical protein